MNLFLIFFNRQSCFVFEQNFITNPDDFLLEMVDFGVDNIEKDEEGGYIWGRLLAL